LIRHNGGTGGYRSYLGFDRTHGTGVAALSNGASLGGVDSLALAILGR
jgi:D-alanyl-D-alanine-carboxypeptidase/D-alanyl-D-alanine-endopeptidase